jgi:hypothetical protein
MPPDFSTHYCFLILLLDINEWERDNVALSMGFAMDLITFSDNAK